MQCNFEPCVKMGRIATLSVVNTPLTVHIKNKIWDEEIVDAPVVTNPDKPQDYETERQFEVDVEKLYFRPIPYPGTTDPTSKLKDEYERNKRVQRSKYSSSESKPVDKKFGKASITSVFPIRSGAKNLKVLLNERQNRWNTDDSWKAQAKHTPSSTPRLIKISRGMHGKRNSKKYKTASTKQSTDIIQTKLTQQILEIQTDMDDKLSYVSGASARDLILTTGHATDVPKKLRYIDYNHNNKVKDWLAQ